MLSLRSLLLSTLVLTVLGTSWVEAQPSRRSSRSVGGSVKAEDKSAEAVAEEAEERPVRWAELELSGLMPEGPSLPGLFGEISETMTRLFDRLDKAASDDKIDAIVLKINNPLVGMGTVHELRTKIMEVRQSGKPVIAQLETALTTDYLIASACDKIYMPEPGMLLMTGVRAEVSFYKNLIDMLDVEADILRVGKYKSAAEPYTRTEMSPQFREEISELLDGRYSLMINMIAKARNLKPEQVEAAIDAGPHTSSSALDAELIDGILYQDQLEELALNGDEDREFELVSRYGKEKVDVDFEGFTGMIKMMNLLMGVEPGKKRSTTPMVAVIYASGAIMSGSGSSGPFGDEVIGSETMIKAIKEANENKRVRAIVLRVNSPGGSALASDLIWRALEQVDKPIVVSMGDVAASGGYYISMGADYIYAEPGTVTGSIGVVGGKLAFDGLFKKLGITTDYVTRGKNSGALSVMQPFTDSERVAMQKMLNDIYRIFTDKAAAGREMPVEKIRELGGGRIYLGTAAVDNGLVDEIGTLDDAIAKAKELAGLDEDQDIEKFLLPKPTSPFEQLFGPIETRMQYTNSAIALDNILPVEMTAQIRKALLLEKLTATDPRLLMMPFDLKFE